jgi:hypothetical protein
MDGRIFIDIVRDDGDRRARRDREEWAAWHRRPDALPLPPEESVPWTRRVAVLRVLFAAPGVARRIRGASGRGRRREAREVRIDGVG